MKTWLKKGTWLKSAALLALPVALLLVILGGSVERQPRQRADGNSTLAPPTGPRWSRCTTPPTAPTGRNNTNWGSDQPLNQWHGVTTNDDGRVTRLDLSENNLSGPIPAQLGDLNLLVELSLHRNEITGQIPSWLADLDNLAVAPSQPQPAHRRDTGVPGRHDQPLQASPEP